MRGSGGGSAGCAGRPLKLCHAQDAIDRLVRLYGNVCCHGSMELAELELKSELRSQLKLERCALGLVSTGSAPAGISPFVLRSTFSAEAGRLQSWPVGYFTAFPYPKEIQRCCEISVFSNNTRPLGLRET